MRVPGAEDEHHSEAAFLEDTGVIEGGKDGLGRIEPHGGDLRRVEKKAVIRAGHAAPDKPGLVDALDEGLG